MSAMVKTAGHPLGVVRQGPIRLVIWAVFAVSIAAGAFAVGRATNDPQAVAVNGGSLSVGAVHPERGTIVYRRTRPAQASETAQRDRQRHRPAEALAGSLSPEQAIKDCQIHRHQSC